MVGFKKFLEKEVEKYNDEKHELKVLAHKIVNHWRPALRAWKIFFPIGWSNEAVIDDGSGKLYLQIHKDKTMTLHQLREGMKKLGIEDKLDEGMHLFTKKYPGAEYVTVDDAIACAFHAGKDVVAEGYRTHLSAILHFTRKSNKNLFYNMFIVHTQNGTEFSVHHYDSSKLTSVAL